MRLYNESKIDSASRPKYYLGNVETVDENYIVTFSIPKILINCEIYPTAYPKNTDHVKEIKKGDSIIVEQLDTTTQFFMYSPINKNINTGIYFGDVKVDITDGKTIKITTPNVKIQLDSTGNNIFIGNDEYSLGQFLIDLDKALSSLHTEGSPGKHTAAKWYGESILPLMQKAQMLFIDKVTSEEKET